MASTSVIISVGCRSHCFVQKDTKNMTDSHTTHEHLTLANCIDVSTVGGAEEGFQGFRKPLSTNLWVNDIIIMSFSMHIITVAD